MDLLEQVVANLELETGTAEKGIGAILMALRMSVPPADFERIKEAVPTTERMMGRALMSGGRTGEMAAPVGPAGLLAALGAAGVLKEDVPRLARIVVEYLRPTIGGATLDKFLDAHPPLKA
ncbi:MAG TPA: DUF2780 domain-containing protein [Gemmatimonadales bacterium]